MTFEEAVGRVKAYEDRLQSLEVNEDEQGKLLVASEQKYGESSGRGRGCGRHNERVDRPDQQNSDHWVPWRSPRIDSHKSVTKDNVSNGSDDQLLDPSHS
ncbi:hypothetical protein E3N88_13687 [Mikania micrantha]|uniref:Uncharacterized protein n=1 Tax=Mikania micrantha TaxID=192012 RepID=A0A5N6P0H8_9ASTR|nr:hypothetical protein E3N88_13687 [Mikania micrantha]